MRIARWGLCQGLDLLLSLSGLLVWFGTNLQSLPRLSLSPSIPFCLPFPAPCLCVFWIFQHILIDSQDWFLLKYLLNCTLILNLHDLFKMQICLPNPASHPSFRCFSSLGVGGNLFLFTTQTSPSLSFSWSPYEPFLEFHYFFASVGFIDGPLKKNFFL